MSVISGREWRTESSTFGLGCGFRRWELSGRRSYSSPQIFHQLRLTELEENVETICSNPSFHMKWSSQRWVYSLRHNQRIPTSWRHESPLLGCQFHLFVPLINPKISDHQWSFPTVSLNLGDLAESGYPPCGEGYEFLVLYKFCTNYSTLFSISLSLNRCGHSSSETMKTSKRAWGYQRTKSFKPVLANTWWRCSCF